MSLPHEITDGEPGLGPWAILHGYRGSVAHGMYEPPENPLSIDDKDTMAICVPPLDYYYGLSEYGSRGTREIKRGEWDVVIYEARKAVRMLAQGNPNILSLLWLPEGLYIACCAWVSNSYVMARCASIEVGSTRLSCSTSSTARGRSSRYRPRRRGCLLERRRRTTAQRSPCGPTKSASTSCVCTSCALRSKKDEAPRSAAV
jgi:RNA repair pathway DNA polymerase beta family